MTTKKINLLSLIIILTLLPNCSNSSYFSKEGQTASSAGYSCPWSKGHVNITEDSHDVTMCGVGSLSQTTIKGNLTINGAATIDTVTIQKNLIVNGTANIKNSIIKDNATIHGTATFDDSTISQNAITFGLFQAQKSTFHDVEIHVDDYAITLDHCTTNNIRIKGYKNTPITLELVDTTISGNINFVNCIGKVVLHGTSTIKGTLSGGTLAQ